MFNWVLNALLHIIKKYPTEAYSEFCQTAKMECFEKRVND